MKLELSFAAREDLLAGQDYYDAERPGLGAEFLEDLEAVMARAAHSPLQFAVVPGTKARRARASRFPYLVIFFVLDDRVRVVAVAHEHQRPNYWRSRS